MAFTLLVFLLSFSDKLQQCLFYGKNCIFGFLIVTVFSLGELHLTPIHGALQLRPSFEYLNKGEANVRAQNASFTEEGIYKLYFILN